MKKLGFCTVLFCFFCLTGCTNQSTHNINPITSTLSENNKLHFNEALNSVFQPPTKAKEAPDGEPDGSYSGFLANGGDYKTVIKNGYFDDYVVVYYPNLLPKFKTKLVNGLAEGWANYREPTGRIQRILYHQAQVQEAIIFYPKTNDKILYHFWYQDGKPVKGEKLNEQGEVIDSFLISKE